MIWCKIHNSGMVESKPWGGFVMATGRTDILMEITFLNFLKFTEWMNETWPESLKFTTLVLQSSAQQRHSWILQVVVAQVQLSKITGLGVEHWGQNFKSFLREVTHFQSKETIVKKMKIQYKINYICVKILLLFISKWVLTKVQLQQPFWWWSILSFSTLVKISTENRATRTSVYLQELNYFLYSVWS